MRKRIKTPVISCSNGIITHKESKEQRNTQMLNWANSLNSDEFAFNIDIMIAIKQFRMSKNG